MNRRTWLATVGLLGTGGCLGSLSGDGPDTTTPTETPSRETTRSMEPSPSSGRRTPVRRVAIDGVSDGPRWIRVHETTISWHLDYREYTALEASVRAAVDEAIDGTYETETVSPELRTFLVDVAHVKRGERFYTFEASIPVYELRASRADEPPASIDGEVASATEFEAVAPDSLLSEAWGEPIRLVDVGPDLRAFLERYDAVEYEHLRSLVIEFEFERIDPGPPYTMDASRVPDDEVDGGEAFEFSALSEPVRNSLLEAIRWRRTNPTADPPRVLVDRYDGHGQFTVDDEAFSYRVEELADLPLSFDATVTDPVLRPGDRAELRASVTNEGEEPLVLSHGAPAPFGVLEAVQPDGTGWILWTDAYEEAPNVSTSNRLVWNWTSGGDETRLGAGDTLEHSYELPGESFAPGSYDLDLRVRARRPSDDAEEPYRQQRRFEIRFEVSGKGT